MEVDERDGSNSSDVIVLLFLSVRQKVFLLTPLVRKSMLAS